MARAKVLVLQLPSPPNLDVNRDYAGGFGVGLHVRRDDYGHTGGGFELMPNVVLSHATGLLKSAGHDVDFCDGQVERLTKGQVLNRTGDADLLVTCLNLPSLDGDRALLRAIRDASPGLPIVAVGTVCRVLPQEALADGLVDFSPMAEEERLIAAAADCVAERRRVLEVPGGLAWIDGSLRSTGPPPPPVPLDEMPFPAYDLMPMKGYTMELLGRRYQYAPIYSSRGCPYPCTYCPYPVGLGSRVQYRRPERTLKEIELVHDLGADGLIFRDQTFTLNRGHSEVLCDALAARRLELKWGCETRVDLVDATLLKKMRAAGCLAINFGMETGDPALFEKIGKPGASTEDLKTAVALTKKAGIFARVHIIVGLPGETWDTIQSTLSTLYELKVDNADFNIITPYPGTSLYRYAKEKGLIEATDWSEYTSVNATMRTEGMTRDELVRAQTYLDWAFRKRAPFVTRWGRRWRVFRYYHNKKEQALRLVALPVTYLRQRKQLAMSSRIGPAKD